MCECVNELKCPPALPVVHVQGPTTFVMLPPGLNNTSIAKMVHIHKDTVLHFNSGDHCLIVTTTWRPECLRTLQIQFLLNDMVPFIQHVADKINTDINRSDLSKYCTERD